MTPERPMPPQARSRRRSRVLQGVLGCAGALLLAGCGGQQGLASLGAHEQVTAPRVLWPDHQPPPPGGQPGQPVRVPGVPVPPGGDLRKADALAVVKADFAASAGKVTGRGREQDPRATRALATCEGSACPVREPMFHNLTGSGPPELIVAVDIDGRLSELRVYTVKDGAVVRVLARRAVVLGVEVAAGHLTVREPSSNPDQVSVSDYAWNGAVMSLWDLSLDDCGDSRCQGTSATTPPARPESEDR
ncbi:hypothetical protein [Streptomyces sp. NPDC059009]|uniref:hypothetical protein n=1 Tax=Streptomyces sp. NPDC059009 TaxID=3346694 RepID=UPI0036C48A50